MIEEEGRIVALAPGEADVEIERTGGCGSCSARGTCGTAQVAAWLGRPSEPLRVQDPIGAQLGDRVVIGIREGALLGAAVRGYLAPLVALLLVGGTLALVAERWFPAWGDLLSLIGGGLGFGASLWWLARRKGDPGLQPVILRRVSTVHPIHWAPGQGCERTR